MKLLAFLILSHFVALASAGAETALIKGPDLPRTKACREWTALVLDEGKTEEALTDQVVVMDGQGRTLFNWADGAYRPETPHQLWSISKTLNGLIAGAAVHQGRLSLDDQLAKYVPARRPKTKALYEQIAIRDLLSMTSGFKWSEHPDDNAQQSSDLPFFYSYGYRNLTNYVLNLDFEARPGEKFIYSSVNGVLLNAALKNIYGVHYERMPWDNLFLPLNLKSARFEQDAAGVYVGSAYIYLSAEDLAKVGIFMLNDGKIGERRHLPEGWLDWSRELVPPSLKGIKAVKDLKREGPWARGGFWLNYDVPGFGRPFPGVPADAYWTTGLFGQLLMVIPSKNLVIARTAHDGTINDIHEKVTVGALRCFRGGRP